MEKPILCIFLFETGDATCRYWDVPKLVYCHSTGDLDSIEDSFDAYLDSDASEDKEYDEMVEEVLNASGLRWRPAYIGTYETCYGYRIFYL